MAWGRRPLAVGAAALALLVGCSGSTHPSPTRPGDRLPDAGADHQPPAAGPSSRWAGRRPQFPLGAGYRATPLPVRVQIPKIGVASSLDRLGRARDGTVQVPSRWAWLAGTRSARVPATEARRCS
jgi:hypothetical protein